MQWKLRNHLVSSVCCASNSFVGNDQVMINEVAPRPHNSGHLTIEACETSQFEQHVRAVCNLPLGSTKMRCQFAAMVNLLGDLWDLDGTPPNWDLALADPGVSLHLYGKRIAKPGRKMGHLTVTGDNRDDVAARVVAAQRSVEWRNRQERASVLESSFITKKGNRGAVADFSLG